MPDSLAKLLGPPGDLDMRNAAPAGPRNGVAIDKEAGKLREELYPEIAALLGRTISVLDQPVQLTFFDDAKAKRQRPHRMSLRQLGDVIRTARADEKANLPWLKLASFGAVPTVHGSLRHDDNMTAIHGIEGDYDAGLMSVSDAAERLRAADLAALVYTTPSHTAEAPRWRVLAPTTEPLTPAARDALIERLNGALGGVLAPESFARSQSYYFGAVGSALDHSVAIVDGRAIDKAHDVQGIGKRGVVDAASAALAATPVDDFARAVLQPDYDRIARALAHVPADDRDDWLKVGMALHSASFAGSEGLEAWLTWSRTSAKFDERDLMRVWRSFGRERSRRVTIASIFDLAKFHGWNEVLAPSPAEPSRLSFLSPADCAASPSRGYVIKGMLAPGDVGCIFGAPGAGKSLISPHLGYAVAQGREAFGMRSKPGRVFYVAAEDPHGMRGRVTALRMRQGDATAFTLVEGVSDLLSEASPDLAALATAIEEQRPALVFLDTLAMAFPGLEENSADAMGRVVAVARSLAQWGAAVVLIHHDTKAEGRTPRGHSLLNGALDMAMHVSRDDDGVVRGKLTKNRNGSCDHDVAFRIATETLGLDEDGDAITAALVDELTHAPIRAERLSASSQAALDVLRHLESDKAGLSGDRPGVREDDWREACVDGRAVSGSEDAESRRRAFRRALQTLAAKRRIFVRDDMVWTFTFESGLTYGDLSDGFDGLD